LLPTVPQREQLQLQKPLIGIHFPFRSSLRCSHFFTPPVAIYLEQTILWIQVLHIFFTPSIESVVFLPSSAPTIKAFNVADAVSVNGTMALDIAFFVLGADVVPTVATASFAVSHRTLSCSTLRLRFLAFRICQ
jgi:hypothetical protein